MVSGKCSKTPSKTRKGGGDLDARLSVLIRRLSAVLDRQLDDLEEAQNSSTPAGGERNAQILITLTRSLEKLAAFRARLDAAGGARSEIDAEAMRRAIRRKLDALAAEADSRSLRRCPQRR